MADNNGSKNGPSKKRSRLRYFYLNGQLHKKLTINRGKDLIVTWNYPEVKRVSYTYSDVLRRYKRAFTTKEVCSLVNRSRQTVDTVMRSGMIEFPQHTYGLDEHRRIYQYLWSEEDIMGLLEYLATVHRGRPRHDGEITPQALPTPRELRAMINDESILYIKQGDQFIPSWRAKEF